MLSTRGARMVCLCEHARAVSDVQLIYFAPVQLQRPTVDVVDPVEGARAWPGSEAWPMNPAV